MPSRLTAFFLLAAASGVAMAQAAPACHAQSAAMRTPVIELYTSEGCSSCPPADRWLSGLKGEAAEGRVVALAFHVGYWDYIGWVDRFASPAHTTRQREIAARNRQSNISTPQLVRDGQDWRDYAKALSVPTEPASVAIRMERTRPDAVEAEVAAAGATPWTAYWSVTEHGHASKVAAGENAGEFLKHDFVVRQFVSAGQQRGAQKLVFRQAGGRAPCCAVRRPPSPPASRAQP